MRLYTWIKVDQYRSVLTHWPFFVTHELWHTKVRSTASIMEIFDFIKTAGLQVNACRKIVSSGRKNILRYDRYLLLRWFVLTINIRTIYDPNLQQYGKYHRQKFWILLISFLLSDTMSSLRAGSRGTVRSPKCYVSLSNTVFDSNCTI